MAVASQPKPGPELFWNLRWVLLESDLHGSIHLRGRRHERGAVSHSKETWFQRRESAIIAKMYGFAVLVQ